jgi:hypothetical protein
MKESNIKVGDILESINYGYFMVIKKKSKIYTVKFLETDYITNVYYASISSRRIKDNLLPDICGIGCLGYANKKDNKKYYITWRNMLYRCYDIKNKNYHQYGSKGIRVCERWLRFDYFLEDVKSIDGFNEEKVLSRELQLDKDIKQIGIDNKIYSKNTCCWVTSKNNNNYRSRRPDQKMFMAISPNNEIYSSYNIHEFGRMYSLTPTHISKCLNKKESAHKGWKFKYIESEAKVI